MGDNGSVGNGVTDIQVRIWGWESYVNVPEEDDMPVFE